LGYIIVPSLGGCLLCDAQRHCLQIGQIRLIDFIVQKSPKSLVANGLGGPGPPNSLIVNDLGLLLAHRQPRQH
jgi:hypothetical protein